MKKYLIYYFGGKPNKNVNDVIEANSPIEACKKFTIATCGTYCIHSCKEIIVKKAVCVLIMKNGKALCVSRKDDPNDFGLPGGKVDDGESLEDAVRRELLEETGYVLKKLTNMTFTAVEGDFEVTTFLGMVSDDEPNKTHETESGVVAWLNPTQLLYGSFGSYNYKVIDHFGVL